MTTAARAVRSAPKWALAAGLLGLAACGPGGPLKPPVDTAKVIDTIKADEVRWNADYRSGDAARLAAHYAPDAVVMTPGQAPVVGAAAIQGAMDKMVGQPGFSLTFSADRVDVSTSGDLAASHGAYHLTTTDPKTGTPAVETGSYVTVYKPATDGTWKAVWDINTPGAAATPPAPGP